MADNKAATAAAQTQSDKPKKNDGKKKVSFFDKVKNFFQRDRQVFQRYKERAEKGRVAQQERRQNQYDHRYRGRAGRSCRADPAGPHLWRRIHLLIGA